MDSAVALASTGTSKLAMTGHGTTLELLQLRAKHAMCCGFAFQPTWTRAGKKSHPLKIETSTTIKGGYMHKAVSVDTCQMKDVDGTLLSMARVSKKEQWVRAALLYRAGAFTCFRPKRLPLYDVQSLLVLLCHAVVRPLLRRARKKFCRSSQPRCHGSQECS